MTRAAERRPSAGAGRRQRPAVFVVVVVVAVAAVLQLLVPPCAAAKQGNVQRLSRRSNDSSLHTRIRAPDGLFPD